jgi:hypothetical protein
MRGLTFACLPILALATPGLAGDIVVRAMGTVIQVPLPPVSGPFVAVQAGDSVELRIEVARQSLATTLPNHGAYLLDAPVSTLRVGAASDTFSTATSTWLSLWNSYAGIRDEVFFTNRQLSQGDRVTLALLDTTDTAFHTQQILHLRGTYPAASWTTRTFYLDAGGAIIQIAFTELEIGAYGPGEIVCAPAIANSTGWPALINATGTDMLAANDLGLEARSLPTQTFGFFIVSRTPASVLNPGGSQGRLCLGGAIGRYQNQVQNSGALGMIAMPVNTNALPSPTGPIAAAVGEQWFFQAWYRDANPTSTSNFTDTVAVTFQ